MKLQDLQTPIDDQTDEQLLERLRQIRHNRFIERPAVKAREEKEEKLEVRRTGKKASNKIDKALAGMTPEQLQQLMDLLQGQGNAT